MAKTIAQLKEQAAELGIPLSGGETAAKMSMLIAGATGDVPQPQMQAIPSNVTFTPEQVAVMEQMFAKMSQDAKNDNPNSPVSVYNTRDIRKIEAIRVRRFDGKFVMGFKNLQNDPYKKTPKWIRTGPDIVRKLPNEPHITLLLSSDGEAVEEKEVMLIDYMDEREFMEVPVIKVDEKEVTHDHGILGRVGGDMAVMVDSKGQPEQRLAIRQESKTVERVFTVQLPGFKHTSEFISDFLA